MLTHHFECAAWLVFFLPRMIDEGRLSVISLIIDDGEEGVIYKNHARNELRWSRTAASGTATDI
jgi:hypothetical protein